MEILDNARIVRTLTDKGTWGVWGFIKSMLQEVEISEKKIACLRNGNECNQCDKWWGCVGGLSSIEIDSFEQGFDNLWKKSIQDLNLGDLHHWLIDDSGSKDELKFRLDKVKGIIGTMWSDKEISQLHVETSGIKSNGEMLLRSDGTMLGGIMPRMIEVITELNDNETEESATMKVEKVWNIVKSRLFQIECIISHMRAMLKEAEQILNPQLTPTETEPQKNISTNNHLLEDDEVKEVFEAFVDKGYMEYTGKYYKWTKSHHLLAYFCEKVSLYFLYSTKTYEGKAATEWKSFSGLFEVVVKGKVEHPNNDRLRVYKNNWYRGKDREAVEFLPDGYRGVEDILADLH